MSTFVLGKYVSPYPGKSIYFLITIKNKNQSHNYNYEYISSNTFCVDCALNYTIKKYYKEIYY